MADARGHVAVLAPGVGSQVYLPRPEADARRPHWRSLASSTTGSSGSSPTYLAKPFTADQIPRRVRELFDGRSV
jgi:hypothetical protein